MQLKIKIGLNPSCRTPVRAAVYPTVHLHPSRNIQGKTSVEFVRGFELLLTLKRFLVQRRRMLHGLTIFGQINWIVAQECKGQRLSQQGEEVLWPSVRTRHNSRGKLFPYDLDQTQLICMLLSVREKVSGVSQSTCVPADQNSSSRFGRRLWS